MNQKLCTVLFLCCLSGCFSESNFRLSEESRLPKWFEVPDGKKREDIVVQLYYYVKPGGREAKLVLTETGGWLSKKKVQGNLRGLRSLRIGFASENSYPRYEVMTSNGITDIIVHIGKNDLFYMVDDPAVWSELGIDQK